MLRTANTSGIIVPTDDQVVAFYSATSGYVPGNDATDNGADEAIVCQRLVSTGFLGHKADAVGRVDPQNFSHISWCIQLNGCCRVGLNLPGYAEDQFDAGQPWDVSAGGDQSTEGHDVPLVDYRGGLFYCVSWGKKVPVTPGFLYKYCEEAWAELFFDWIAAQGAAPSGLDLGALAAKMKELG